MRSRNGGQLCQDSRTSHVTWIWMDLRSNGHMGSQIQRTHGISDPTDNHTFLSRNKDYRISIYSYAPSLPQIAQIESTSLQHFVTHHQYNTLVNATLAITKRDNPLVPLRLPLYHCQHKPTLGLHQLEPPVTDMVKKSGEI